MLVVRRLNQALLSMSQTQTSRDNNPNGGRYWAVKEKWLLSSWKELMISSKIMAFLKKGIWPLLPVEANWLSRSS